MSTSLSATIMEFLNSIFGSEAARNEFLADPEGYLADHNLDDLSCADFDDAMASFLENAEFENGRGDNEQGGTFSINLPGPTVPHDGQNDHEAVAEHLTNIVHEYGDTYITNNDNDVINDASFNGTIISGGDVSFDNDITSASGDGAVAAGDDIDGDVVSGDGSFIGDGNQVGDDSAFGDGANSGTQTVDDGGAISNAGHNATATGSNDDNRTDDDTTMTVDSSTTTTIDNSSDDDVDVDVQLEDSLNDNRDQSIDSETTVASHNNTAGDDLNA